MPSGERRPEIRIDRIPIDGGVGALLAIAILLTAMLVQLPQLRPVFFAGVLGGLVFAAVLILWHRRRDG